MSLTVVREKCNFTEDRQQGTIVIESSFGDGQFQQAYDELKSAQAKKICQSFAASAGMVSPRMNNIAEPYPVNSEGLSLDEIKDPQGNSLPPTHPRMKPARYRIDYPLTAPL